MGKKRNNKSKTIIIEDGVVDPSHMVVINVPRKKESAIFYAKKREMFGPNTERNRNKPRYNYNVHEEVNKEIKEDRRRRGNETETTFDLEELLNPKPKVISRHERYGLFRKAMERNYRKTMEELQSNEEIIGASVANQKYSRKGHVTISNPVERPMKIKEHASSMTASNSKYDYASAPTFQPTQYSQSPEIPAPWKFHSNGTYCPDKTFTILPPDNRLFDQTTSCNFSRHPNLQQLQRYVDNDFEEEQTFTGFNRVPLAKEKDYYSLIQDFSSTERFGDKRIRTVHSTVSVNSYQEEDELATVYPNN